MVLLGQTVVEPLMEHTGLATILTACMQVEVQPFLVIVSVNV